MNNCTCSRLCFQYQNLYSQNLKTGVITSDQYEESPRLCTDVGFLYTLFFMNTIPKIAFFGTPNIAVYVLDVLKEHGILPSLIITNPDAPQGRKMLLTPSPVALWGDIEGIPVLKPEKLSTPEVTTLLQESGCDIFIVAAYGKMIPQAILDIPKYKAINIHPSLLPILRGPSPIRTAILEDKNPTGVSIMVLTAGMDEGPLIAQEKVYIPSSEWPIRGRELDELLAKKGAELLISILPDWIQGAITPTEQEHVKATYSKKITKDMGRIDLSDNAYSNLLKIRAFDETPGTYFFHTKNDTQIRVKIVDAEYTDGTLKITRIIPEGKKEMSYEDFLRG